MGHQAGGATIEMSDEKREKVDTWMGMPYDWRRPTKARSKSRWWNPEDPRFFTPRALGWRYNFNLYWVFHRRDKGE